MVFVYYSSCGDIDNIEEVAQRAKGGDSGAMGELLALVEPEVRALAAGMAGRARGLDADDLAQEGAIIAMGLVRSWRVEVGPFLPWLRTHLRPKLKTVASEGEAVRLPAKVADVVRQVRAAEAEGFTVDRGDAAASRGLSLAAVEAGEWIDRDPERAMWEAREAALPGESALAGVLDGLGLREEDRSLILALGADGASSAASAAGVSPRTLWRRAHGALSRAVHPSAAA